MKQEFSPSAQIAKEDLFTEEISRAMRHGNHLWVTLVAYKVSEESLANSDKEFMNLDVENIRSLSIGCYICEEEYSPLLAKRRCKGESGAYRRS